MDPPRAGRRHGPMGAGGRLGKLRDAVPRPRDKPCDKLSDTGERVNFCVLRRARESRAYLEESNNEYWARTAALASAQHQNSRCNGEPLQRRSLPPPSLKPGALKCGTGRA